MAWKPAMKSDSESGGVGVVDVDDIKIPAGGCAIGLADMGRSVLRPYMNLAKPS
jgi:hypothetical protein